MLRETLCPTRGSCGCPHLREGKWGFIPAFTSPSCGPRGVFPQPSWGRPQNWGDSIHPKPQVQTLKVRASGEGCRRAGSAHLGSGTLKSAILHGEPGCLFTNQFRGAGRPSGSLRGRMLSGHAGCSLAQTSYPRPRRRKRSVAGGEDQLQRAPQVRTRGRTQAPPCPYPAVQSRRPREAVPGACPWGTAPGACEGGAGGVRGGGPRAGRGAADPAHGPGRAMTPAALPCRLVAAAPETRPLPPPAPRRAPL